MIADLWLRPVAPGDQNPQRGGWLVALSTCWTEQTNTSHYACHSRSQSSLNPTKINGTNEGFNRFGVRWNWAAITINVKPPQGRWLNYNPVIVPATLRDSAQAKWQRSLLGALARDLGGISIDPLQLHVYFVSACPPGLPGANSVSPFTPLILKYSSLTGFSGLHVENHSILLPWTILRHHIPPSQFLHLLYVCHILKPVTDGASRQNANFLWLSSAVDCVTHGRARKWCSHVLPCPRAWKDDPASIWGDSHLCD